MSDLVFPARFMWGTATSAHQVEGGNCNSDWWEWELKAGTPCKNPSGAAIDHYNRYESDIALLSGLGFYEFRPQAVAATVRRVAELLPGKPIVVTEHGVATADDAERVEFIDGGLAALHPLIGEGIPLRGYIHWSAFDNFEWALGYSMEFGLIAVDRTTQVRAPKPSARHLGDIARANASAAAR